MCEVEGKKGFGASSCRQLKFRCALFAQFHGMEGEKTGSFLLAAFEFVNICSLRSQLKVLRAKVATDSR
jgi:hypothetical protein